MKAVNFVVMALMLTGPAKATTLISSPVFGGSSQNQAYCFIYNGGISTITYTERKIVDNQGASMGISTQSCMGGLAPGYGCYFMVNTNASKLAGTCKVVFTPDSALVRGSFAAFNSGVFLAASPLQ
jgi:hypothetical protein